MRRNAILYWVLLVLLAAEIASISTVVHHSEYRWYFAAMVVYKIILMLLIYCTPITSYMCLMWFSQLEVYGMLVTSFLLDAIDKNTDSRPIDRDVLGVISTIMFIILASMHTYGTCKYMWSRLYMVDFKMFQNLQFAMLWLVGPAVLRHNAAFVTSENVSISSIIYTCILVVISLLMSCCLVNCRQSPRTTYRQLMEMEA